MEMIKTDFEMKGVGPPDYFLGGNFNYTDENWANEKIYMGFSSKTYIENVIPKFEELFEKNFKSVKTPMDTKCHPEIDESPCLRMIWPRNTIPRLVA